MSVDLSMKISIPAQAKSFSMIGRTQDAAAKNDLGKVHKIRRGIHVEAWEGMEMVEAILNEVAAKNRTGKGGKDVNPRGETLLSSPRVSPAIVERDATQTAESLRRSFLEHTACRMDLGGMPACRALSPAGRMRGDTNSPGGEHSSSPTRKRRKQKKAPVHPTAAFLAPTRPSPGEELEGRAPDVGKYTPKYGVVERKFEGVAMVGTHHGKSRKGHHAKKTPSPPPGGEKSDKQTESLSATVNDGRNSPNANLFKLTHADSDRRKADDSPLRAGRSQHSGETGDYSLRVDRSKLVETPKEDYRKHHVPDPSFVFKAVPRKFELPLTADLDYWPFPRPGTTTYAQGRITPGTRITTADKRYGCGPNISYFPEDHRRPQSVIDFSKTVSRDEVRSALASPGFSNSAIEYHPNPDALSTKVRVNKGYTDFKKITGRPPVSPVLSQSEGLALYHDSVATSKKLGYVEFGKQNSDRGFTSFDLYEEPKSAGGPKPLDVNTSLVERRVVGAVPFNKAEKKSVLGSDQSNAPEYHPKYNVVDRHRPTASMRGTSRDAPVLREGIHTERTSNLEIDPDAFDRSRHVTTPALAHQLSRDARNKVLDAKPNASDVVYDVPAPKPRGISFSRLKK